MSFVTEPAAIAAQTVVESAQAAAQLAILTQQLGVLKEIADINQAVLSGGGIIQGILGNSLDVLKGISDEIKKAQATVAPVVALVVEVEKIGAIIKGDVGLNLSSLVDATSRISDTLKGPIGPNISDAVSAGSHEVAQEVSKHAEATAGVAKETAAGAQAIAAAIAKANLELVSRTFFGAFTPSVVARVSQIAICHKQELQADTTLGPIEGVLETITKSLVCIFQTVLQPVIEAGSKTADVIFRPITTTVVGSLDNIFAKLGESDPNRVDQVGGTILAKAIELGMAAHGLAVIAEAAYPTKNLGLPQIAAFLVDVAGFKVVGDAIVGEQINAVLRQPMRHRSNFLHRPRLPELREVMQAWSELALSDEDFKQLLRFHGIPEKFLPMFFEIADREPRFRELGVVFDNVEVDAGWLTRALQKAGYRGENVIKLREALVAKSNRQHRDALVEELRATVVDGLQSVSWLQSNLRALGFRPETVSLIATRTAAQLSREQARDMAAVWKLKAEQEVISVEEYQLALVGLGFQGEIVNVKVALVSAKLQGKLAQHEKSEHASAIRRAQTTRTTAAIAAFRRGVIDEDQLEAALVGIGIMPDQAAAMVALESVKQIQKPKAAKTLHEDPTAQQILRARRDEALLLLHRDEISPDQALAFLVGLGMDQDLAEALVERELAKLAPPKPLAGLRG